MAEKLKERDLELFRRLLVRLHAEYRRDFDELEGESLYPEEAERGQADYADEVLSDVDRDLLELEDDAVQEIVEALRRVEEGTFGRCEECGSWIDVKRLRCIPYARRCIDCQRKAVEGA